MAVHVDTADREMMDVDPLADQQDQSLRGGSSRRSCVDAGDELATDNSADGPVPGDHLKPASGRHSPTIRLGVAVMIAAIAVLAGLAAWFEHQVLQGQRQDQREASFLQAGRQGALNLTTIDYAEVDADIKRVLDSATGQFKEEFERNSAGFADVVRKVQSKSVGTVTAAGVQSINADSAEVLVALSVKTANAGAAEQQPRLWRMRIGLQKQGDDIKVSNVSFVP